MHQIFSRLDELSSNDLSWYHPQFRGQFINISYTVRQLRVGEETLLENNAFERVFIAVATFVRDNEAVSIDDVVEHLRKTQKMEGTGETFKAQRLLVFAILGWQSMLYRPAVNTCSQDELAVHEDDDQSNSGLVFDTNKVSADLADRPFITHVASENSKAAATWLPLDPAETNTHLLLTLLHVRIRWVDCLALHLDYNKSSRTLSLFSCPSFCVAMLQSKGTIFSFANTEKNSFDPRAGERGISQFMREVLLSFRLLFDQHNSSRKLFPQIYRPTERLQKPDQLLLILCMTKYIHQMSESLPLSPDQPIIELIAKELKSSRPIPMGELLRDWRGTLQY
ncbi:hypothetical protein K469DRAFT_733374 [Zopfia rhizophila CBS 207.26]|uniref:Uncharacterized protein n=1 Tax=Zopfia rhizophila CBS 207.26 TaxID=1314779 RepID=A0A6A6ELB7_9PEZI|nr:hypothetical protein K469DRAFT_733374 [Zopfia rhizophila CBS 207.26]